MKRLFLLRHAKAAPLEGSGEDFDRPLLPRGAADAAAMGRHLVKKRYRPAVVKVSSAARTVQTAELALAGLDGAAELLDTLYLAPLVRILGLIHALPPGAASAMIIGHNPGLEECATLLSRDPPRQAGWDEKFPTCALAVLDFKVMHWGDVRKAEGALADYVTPRDL